ncbi:hypothetical protein J437_LFUL007568, partial [Ladona fulva]
MEDLRQSWPFADHQLGYFVPYHIMHGVYYFAGSQLTRGESPASTYPRSQSPNIQQEKALTFLTTRYGLSPVASLSSSANHSSSSSASSAVNNGLPPDVLEDDPVTEEE